MSDSAWWDRRRIRGFTLVELLVVIAVIAILASVLFPVFAKVKQAAHRAACLSNLKQIGYAVRMYQDDYSGAYPSWGDYPSQVPGWGHTYWVKMLIDGYTRSRKLFNCPGAGNPIEAGSPPMKMSYSYNEYIFYAKHGFYKETKVRRPQYTLLISDGHDCALITDSNNGRSPNAPNNYDGLPSGMIRLKYAEGIWGGALRMRHGCSDVLFCDLHAAHIKPGEYKAENYQSNGWYHPPNLREYPVIWPTALPYL